MCVKSKPFRIMSEIAFRYRCLVHTFPVWLDVTYQHFTRTHLKVHKRSFGFVDSVGEQLPRWWKALLVVCENVIIYSRSTDHIRTSIIFFDKLMEENKFFTYILRSGLIAWCPFCEDAHYQPADCDRDHTDIKRHYTSLVKAWALISDTWSVHDDQSTKLDSDRPQWQIQTWGLKTTCTFTRNNLNVCFTSVDLYECACRLFSVEFVMYFPRHVWGCEFHLISMFSVWILNI